MTTSSPAGGVREALAIARAVVAETLDQAGSAEAAELVRDGQCDGWADVILAQRAAAAALSAPSEPVAPATESARSEAVRRVRHKKRGGIYEVLGEAQVQTSRPLEDYEVVVIYRSLNTPDIDDPASPMKGDTWVRPKSEFEDGRFEALAHHPSAPAPADGGRDG